MAEDTPASITLACGFDAYISDTQMFRDPDHLDGYSSGRTRCPTLSDLREESYHDKCFVQ